MQYKSNLYFLLVHLVVLSLPWLYMDEIMLALTSAKSKLVADNYAFGIFIAPLLHSSNEHFYGNMSIFIPSMIAFWMVVKERFIGFYLALYIIIGMMTVMFGRGGLHVGISGINTVLLFFVIFSGLFGFRKDLIIISIVMLGTNLYALKNLLLAGEEGISIEAHVFGCLLGVVGAYMYWRPFKDFQKA